MLGSRREWGRAPHLVKTFRVLSDLGFLLASLTSPTKLHTKILCHLAGLRDDCLTGLDGWSGEDMSIVEYTARHHDLLGHYHLDRSIIDPLRNNMRNLGCIDGLLNMLCCLVNVFRARRFAE